MRRAAGRARARPAGPRSRPAAAPSIPAQAQDAAAALRAGDYDAAIAALTRQARHDPPAAAASTGARAHAGRGRPLRGGGGGDQGLPGRQPALGGAAGARWARCSWPRGRRAEAEAAFKKAIAGGASDALAAEVNLAVLRLERGERDERR